MDLEIVILSKLRERQISHDMVYIESLKRVEMNKCAHLL